MINPKEITNFHRSDSELFEFWVFCLFVAGKNSDFAAKCVARLFEGVDFPAHYVQVLSDEDLMSALKACRCGQYNRIFKALRSSQVLNLRHCSVSDLESVHGCGPKSARFFLTHSRINQDFATLDTHVLAWLRKQKIPAPKSTPSGKKYLELERIFLDLISWMFPHKSVAEVDLAIWTEMSGRA